MAEFTTGSPTKRGGYLHTGNDAYLIGHVWVEVGDEIADFSVGDWQAEADLIYENTVDPADRALGPIEWWVSPPQFVWQSAASLKTGWRSYGEPMIGQSWYGAWSPCRMPDFASFDLVVSDAAPLIALLVDELHLRERVSVHLGSFPDSAGPSRAAQTGSSLPAGDQAARSDP